MEAHQDPIQLGQFGVWTFQLDVQPTAIAQDAVAELEQLGFGTVWLPEAFGREALSNAATTLSATSRIVVATGVASIYARHPHTAAAGLLGLTEAFPNRFLL